MIIETNWNWSSGLSRRTQTDYIALHHADAATCSAQQIDQWHKEKGWSGIGYHYFVRKDGDVYRGRPEWSVGAHVQGMNYCSIGICAEGNYDKETTMPTTQKDAIVKLMNDILVRYPQAKIVGHRDIGSSDCPGKYYPLDYFKNYNYTRSDELTMSQYEELKSMIGNLSNMIQTLDSKVQKMENPMIYNYIDENMPEWARPTVQKLVNKGILKGSENGLNLTEDLMRNLVVNDRAGLYD